ncbi:MAG: DUF924 family protein [Burkholderiaceae bacterium]|nr:DUF924 family protein [Burkholderiaceae bacterium]
MSAATQAADVLHFWFQELDAAKRFAKDVALDEAIRQRFGAVHLAATRGELFSWRATAQGRLAEIIVLDQFSRNMYRDLPPSFAHDAQALTLAQELVARAAENAQNPKENNNLSAEQRAFAYMPFMHSESQLVHEQAVMLFSQPGLEGYLKFELAHRAIIDQFGRFPHRNATLWRTSTPEEVAFLKQAGSHF